MVKMVWDELTTTFGGQPHRAVLTFADGLEVTARHRLLTSLEAEGVPVDRILRHSVSAGLGLAWGLSSARGFEPLSDLLVPNPPDPSIVSMEQSATLAVVYMGYEQTEIMCADYLGGPDGVVDVTMVCSDEHCGVRDLDDAVVARLITLISAHLERSFEPDHEEYGELLRVAAQIRYILSSETETDIWCPRFNGFAYRIDRGEWTHWVAPITRRLRSSLQDWLECLEAKGHALDAAVCMGALRGYPVLSSLCETSFGQAFYRGRAVSPEHDQWLLDGTVATAGIINGHLRTLLLLDAVSIELGVCIGTDSNSEAFEAVATLIPRGMPCSGQVKLWMRPRNDRTHRAVIEIVEKRRNVTYQTIGMVEFRALDADVYEQYVLNVSCALGIAATRP